MGALPHGSAGGRVGRTLAESILVVDTTGWTTIRDGCDTNGV